MKRTRAHVAGIGATLLCAMLWAQTGNSAAGNKPERLAWFAELGFGMAIDWSLDSQLGAAMSHSLVGADAAYVRRYFEELPATFNPVRFDPGAWADLARLAGVKYVVFSAKHHNGFCMFDTRTTGFKITAAPFGRDVTREVIEAFRARGIAIGLSFSPFDFHYLHTTGRPIAPRLPEASPQGNPELMRRVLAQVEELLTGYGPIDIFSIDGPAEGLRERCWQLQPDIVVTRGAIATAEQHILGVPPQGPWEASMAMGTQRQYRPVGEVYKSGAELIECLIETRAKGGNLLLNVGPRPDGLIPAPQEALLREMALWRFVNGDAITGVQPWIVTNEDTIWFTRKRGEPALYAIVTGTDWPLGARKEFTLRSVRLGPAGAVRVLGQTGEVLDGDPEAAPRTQWRQDESGLTVSAVRAQRLYGDARWPNAVTLVLSDAHPALTPPLIVTGGAQGLESGGAVLRGELASPGTAPSVRVGFQYRPRHDRTRPRAEAAPWLETEFTALTAPDAFTAEVAGLEPGGVYEYRALVAHPRITLHGDIKQVTVPRPKAPAAEAQWTSLFDGKSLGRWKPIEGENMGYGRVFVENETLVLDAGFPMTGIAWDDTTPTTNYEIACEACRLDGYDFFYALTFPVGETFCTLITGGWGGSCLGLSNVDHMPANSNATSRFLDFESNTWYAIRVRVTDERIQVWFDGDRQIDQPRAGHSFSIWPEQEPCRPLGVATWWTKAALRNFRIRRLDPGE